MTNSDSQILSAFGISSFTNAPSPTRPLYSAEAVKFAGLTRFNPLRTLTPSGLADALDAFDRGNLSAAARLFRVIAERDETISCVKPKRELDAAEADWQIAKEPDADPKTATLHAAALSHFYSNLTATKAMDRNYQRGCSGLLRSMMEAVSYRYAVHHIVWKPAGQIVVPLENNLSQIVPAITAEFEAVPLECFENTTGRLRFLGLANVSDGVDGIPMRWDNAEWMVTCGDGLMFAGAIVKMFKTLGLSDWLTFLQDYAQGKVLGRTSAAKGTDAATAFAQLVSTFTGGSRAVVYGDDGALKDLIQTFQQSGTGSADAFEKLVERMDRKLASLWRGADLSTISSADGAGASLQGGEGDILLRADVGMLCETLWQAVDKKVIEWTFGPGVKPAAYFTIPLASDPDLSQIRESAGFLADRKVPVSAANVAQRLGFALAADGEPVLQAVQAMGVQREPLIPAFNARLTDRDARMKQYQRNSVAELAAALKADMGPLHEAIAPLAEAIAKDDAAAIAAAAKALQPQLDKLAPAILRAPSKMQAALLNILSPAVIDGLANPK